MFFSAMYDIFNGLEMFQRHTYDGYILLMEYISSLQTARHIPFSIRSCQIVVMCYVLLIKFRTFNNTCETYIDGLDMVSMSSLACFFCMYLSLFFFYLYNDFDTLDTNVRKSQSSIHIKCYFFTQ